MHVVKAIGVGAQIATAEYATSVMPRVRSGYVCGRSQIAGPQFGCLADTSGYASPA
jgi:hypothetical protein